MTQDEMNEKARAILLDKDGNPTSNYQAYMKYEDEWREKVKAYNEAYENASTNPLNLQRWPIEGRLFQHDIDQAWDRWIALGFKNEIENAISILSSSTTEQDILKRMQTMQNQKK